MRDRLENILHSKNLGNIYYLNYEVNVILKGKDTLNKEFQHLKFKRLIGDIQNPILPKKVFILDREFGSFNFLSFKTKLVTTVFKLGESRATSEFIKTRSL